MEEHALNLPKNMEKKTLINGALLSDIRIIPKAIK
jgi:hypothetical protein